MNINNFYIDDKDYQAICYSWHAQLLDQFALSHFYQSNQILKKLKLKQYYLKLLLLDTD